MWIPASVAGDAAFLVAVELGPLLAALPTLAVAAGGFSVLVAGRGAFLPAASAVVDVLAGVLLAPVAPISVAIRPSGLAGVLAAAAIARGGSIRDALAHLAASAAVVQILTGIGLAAVHPVAVAIGPPGLASVQAFAVGALGGGVGDVFALLAAFTAVAYVLPGVGLAAIVPAAVAIGPAGLAGVLALAIGALGNRIGDILALLATGTAVVGVLSGVGLAAILPVIVAVGPSRLAGVVAFAVVALGEGVGRSYALLATVPAIVGVVRDAGLTAGLVAVAVLVAGGACWIGRICRTCTTPVVLIRTERAYNASMHVDPGHTLATYETSTAREDTNHYSTQTVAWICELNP